MLRAEPYAYPAMHSMDAVHPAAEPRPPAAQPESQESLLSVVSSTFSAPRLPSGGSNLSASTTLDPGLASPASGVMPLGPGAAGAAVAGVGKAWDVRAQPYSPTRGGTRVLDAGRVDAAVPPPQGAEQLARAGDTAAGPMMLDASPRTQGAKRTADGAVKSIQVGMADGNATAIGNENGGLVRQKEVAAHKRNKSMDVHSSTRIGELSAQLKTRLSYAMVKVQNGWEKHSFEELEENHSQRGSPHSAPGRSDGARVYYHSPSTFGRQRRPSAISENEDQMIISPASDPMRSSATTPLPYWRPASKPALHAAASLISITSPHLHQYPHPQPQPIHPNTSLAPAPSFHPPSTFTTYSTHTNPRRRRSNTLHAHIPPPLLSSHANRKGYSSDLSPHHIPSHTHGTTSQPATPRAGILRMPSQQAEKDAVDTLLFMSSPNNSGRFPAGVHDMMGRGGGAAGVGTGREGTQRRVMFEAFPEAGGFVGSGR